MASPLTTAQQVRLRISDRWRYAEETHYGNGSGSGFKVSQGAPFSTLSAFSGYILLPSPTGWSATGGTFDTGLGLAKFSSVVTALTAVRFDYQWALFSDDEIGHFTALGSGVAGAALEAVRVLMFDSLRRSKWAAPDGTEYDDTAAMKQLLEMEKRLIDELARDIGPEGGLESWSENQAYWSTEYGA